MTKLTNYLNWFHTYINEKYQIVVIMKENNPKLEVYITEQKCDMHSPITNFVNALCMLHAQQQPYTCL